MLKILRTEVEPDGFTGKHELLYCVRTMVHIFTLRMANTSCFNEEYNKPNSRSLLLFLNQKHHGAK